MYNMRTRTDFAVNPICMFLCCFSFCFWFAVCDREIKCILVMSDDVSVISNKENGKIIDTNEKFLRLD